uniref:SCP domain-containing protein n=1 Tax=viral metagenome TaxID=1070528 RepID=A0A6C0I3K8_9ZZZZ
MTTIVQPVLTPSQITDIVSYVNKFRANHQAPPMSWSPTIYGVSQQWSYYLIANNLFQHSNNSSYGENLAHLQGYGVHPVALIKKSIDLWYAEVSAYDFTKPGFSTATGHFTCLVWFNSTQFAIGLSINSATNAVNIVMNTSPPGNYLGQFQQNVLPLLNYPSPGPTPSPGPIPSPGPGPGPTTPIADLYAVLQLINTNKRKSEIVAAINRIILKLST